MRFSFRARANGRSTIYQAHQQHFPGQHQHDHRHDHDQSGINGLFEGRGPGRILITVGMVVAGFGFVGWASIVFGMWRMQNRSGAEDQGFAAVLGPMLPSGVQVGVFYFLSFGLGMVLIKIGGSMAKAGAQRASVLGHLVATVVIVGIVVLAILVVIDGAPLSLLQPRFS